MKDRTRQALNLIGSSISKLFKGLVLMTLIVVLCPCLTLFVIATVFNYLLTLVYVSMRIAPFLVSLWKSWHLFVAPLLILCGYFSVCKVVKITTNKSGGWLATGINCGFLLALCGYVMAMVN